jgi:hypothetical protein
MWRREGTRSGKPRGEGIIQRATGTLVVGDLEKRAQEFREAMKTNQEQTEINYSL